MQTIFKFISENCVNMLVLALDVMDERRAVKIAEQVSEHVSAIKVNYPLVLSAGIDVIETLSEIKPVIADFKVADIPYTSRLIAEIAFGNGAGAIIAHGFAGRDTLTELREVADRYGGEVYVVTELSSPGGREFMSAHVPEIVRAAVETGCDGLIAPGTRPGRIREVRALAPGLKILCPGIGAQGGSVEDAVRAGADGIIVGRSIYGSDDPVEAAKKFREELESALNSVKHEKAN